MFPYFRPRECHRKEIKLLEPQRASSLHIPFWTTYHWIVPSGNTNTLDFCYRNFHVWPFFPLEWVFYTYHYDQWLLPDVNCSYFRPPSFSHNLHSVFTRHGQESTSSGSWFSLATILLPWQRSLSLSLHRRAIPEQASWSCWTHLELVLNSCWTRVETTGRHVCVEPPGNSKFVFI